MVFIDVVVVKIMNILKTINKGVKFKRSWFESYSDTVHPGFPLCIGYGKEYWMQSSNFN